MDIGLSAARIARAAWRLDRADRLEVEVFAHRSYGNAGVGLALIRDGNGTRSVETLMRYRGAAMAELMRALRALNALQAKARACPAAVDRPAARATKPDEPKSGANPCEADESTQACDRVNPSAPHRGDPSLGLSLPRPLPAPDRAALHARPIEPELQPPCGLRPAAP